jgi:hypothetical protein
MNKPLEKFYYGIVTDTKGVKKYLACDDNSGGYPYLTPNPTIFYDTKYLKSHQNDSYLNQIADGGKYTLTIYEVNPNMSYYEAVTAV